MASPPDRWCMSAPPGPLAGWVCMLLALARCRPAGGWASAASAWPALESLRGKKRSSKSICSRRISAAQAHRQPQQQTLARNCCWHFKRMPKATGVAGANGRISKARSLATAVDAGRKLKGAIRMTRKGAGARGTQLLNSSPTGSKPCATDGLLQFRAGAGRTGPKPAWTAAHKAASKVHSASRAASKGQGAAGRPA